MLSAKKNPGFARRTLARKLAWTLTVVAAAAAIVTSVAAMGVADILMVAQVRRSAQDASGVLAAELDENPALIAELEDEANELGIAMRVAATRDGKLISGTPMSLPKGDHECFDDELAGGLVCRRAMATDPRVFVYAAASAERVYGHRRPFALAAAGVLLVVILAAALFGFGLARRFLAPLERLRRAVLNVDASAPTAVQLPPPTGLSELDALRFAVSNLLNRLSTELDRARTFAANAAHELRTPLTKLGVELDLAAEAGADVLPHTLTRLRATTTRLVALTERLLLLATPRDALETGQGTSISALVEELAGRQNPDELARLFTNTPKADGLVRGDPLLLAAVLDNAVANAMKFSDGPVTVTVVEDTSAGWVVLHIDDEGPGVPPDRAPRLFQPFARDLAADPHPGHGLGLALCDHIVRAYGGEVGFATERAVGARLTIKLPCPSR